MEKTAFLSILFATIIFSGCKKNITLPKDIEYDDSSSPKNAIKTMAAVGTGWVEITTTEQSEQKIHLESANSGVVTRSWNGGADSWYMDLNNSLSSSFSSNSTVGYSFESSNKTHTFSMFKFPGKRSEIRIHDDYITGTRQFEGYITLNDKVFPDNAVFQIFGGGTGTATLMQIRGDGATGTLNVFENGDLPGIAGTRYIAKGITGVPTRINVIHQQQTATELGKVSIYVNGVFKYSFFESQSPTGVPANYMKYGNYGRGADDNAKTGSVVKWSNVRIWKDGTDGVPDPTYYKIKVLNNPNFILHSASATPINGTNVDVYANGAFATQEWQLIDTEGGYKRIVSKINTNLVLESATTAANGINVQLGTWGGNTNTHQQWSLTDLGNGSHKISLRADATKVLDCSANPANGVNVQMWNYTGNNRQQWILDPIIN